MIHGYCINCWWYLLVNGQHYVVTKNGLKVNPGSGKCYMHNSEEGNYTTVQGDSYCPDYYNRKRGNKEQKITLNEWINARKEDCHE